MVSIYYWVKIEMLLLTSATMQSGTSSTDLSGFNLTFTDTSLELPHFINKSYVDVKYIDWLINNKLKFDSYEL